MLGHKANLSKFKKIEILSSIFSNHNAMRFKIKYKKKKKKLKKYQHVVGELKQYVTKQPMNYIRNQRTPRDK